MKTDTTPHGGAPTLDAGRINAEPFHFHAVDRPMYPDRPWQLVGPNGHYLGPVNWSEDDARALAAALSRISGPAADAAGLVEEARREREIMFMAPSGGNAGDPSTHAANWRDKPHRVLYDACKLIDRLCDALSTRPAAAAREPTPAVGGVALPGVEEIAEALWETEPFHRRSKLTWRTISASDSPAAPFLAGPFRTRAATLRARLADPQARPAAPEGVNGRVQTADVHVFGPVDGMGERHPEGTYYRVVIEPKGGQREHRLFSRGAAEALRDELTGLLASSAPAGGVEPQPMPRPTVPMDQVREAAEAAFSAWLGDEYGSDVLADAMGDLRAALDAGDDGAAAGENDSPDREEVRRIAGRYADHIALDEYEMSVVISAALYAVRKTAPPTTSTATGTEGRDHG